MAWIDGSFDCPNIKVVIEDSGESSRTKSVIVAETRRRVVLPQSFTFGVTASCSECPALTSIMSSGRLTFSGRTTVTGEPLLALTAEQTALENLTKAVNRFIRENCNKSFTPKRL